jgi:hypothetical protein
MEKLTIFVNKNCESCGISLPKMSWCSTCHSVIYCSIKCQKEDWGKHKKYCNKNFKDRKMQSTAISTTIVRFPLFLKFLKAINTIKPKDKSITCVVKKMHDDNGYFEGFFIKLVWFTEYVVFSL